MSRQWPVAPFRAERPAPPSTGAEPPGAYRSLAVFTEPGTGSMVGAMAHTPLTFSPYNRTANRQTDSHISNGTDLGHDTVGS